jgi:hypothetical protein
MIELIGVGMDITDATLCRERRDEKEIASMNKYLYHIHHQVKYYHKSTQAILLLNSEFRETYVQFTRESNLFTACIANFQEDTLMGLTTCKDVHRWYEKEHQALEWIDYISEVQ